MKGKMLVCGALVGAANGLFGGGGGMIAVPALEKGGLPARSAHATAIAAVLPACLVSGAVYLFRGLVPLSHLLPVALGVCFGGFFGAKLLPRIPQRVLNFLFALFMLAAGGRMLF